MNKLDFTPPEGQPPSVLTDPRTISVISASLTPLFIKLGWDAGLQTSAVWLIVALLNVAIYAFGQWRSSKRQQVVNSTLNALAHTNPGETGVVYLPSGETRPVFIPPQPVSHQTIPIDRP